MTRRFVLAVLAMIAVVGLAACGGGGGGGSNTTKKAVDGAITIDAHDTNFDIKTIETTAGPLTVTMKNEGAIDHTFKILGIDPEFELKAKGGKEATGTVELKKGTYDFECTIPGHAAAGMKGKVVVS